jgi:hypothetical protein
LAEQDRAELVRLLARVTVDTEIGADGHKSLSLAITYRFPSPEMTGTVSTRTRIPASRHYTQTPNRSIRRAGTPPLPRPTEPSPDLPNTALSGWYVV